MKDERMYPNTYYARIWEENILSDGSEPDFCKNWNGERVRLLEDFYAKESTLLDKIEHYIFDNYMLKPEHFKREKNEHGYTYTTANLRYEGDGMIEYSETESNMSETITVEVSYCEEVNGMQRIQHDKAIERYFAPHTRIVVKNSKSVKEM